MTGICYSPHPRDFYVRGEHGHGRLANEQVEWNLVWLVFPAMDLYEVSELGYYDIATQVDPILFGTVLGCIRNPVFRNLRKLLEYGPHEILAQPSVLNLITDIEDSVFGMDWDSPVLSRLKQARDRMQPEVRIIQRIEQNVTYADFSRKRLR